jgi:predicted NAD/FAD-dependent oxidoreductase
MASRWVDGRIVDSGASYLTATSPEFRDVVDDWQARGLARPWTRRFQVIHGPTADLVDGTTGPVRFAAPRGLRSLVADLAARSGIDVRQSTPVRLVEPGPVVDGDPADAVVLAMPDPQARRHLAPALEAERARLTGRVWSPALALLAGWSHRCWALVDGAFVHDDGVLTWIADDGRRRGDDAPVLVAHSTAAFAAARLADPPAAAAELVAAVRRLLAIAAQPAWAYVQPWTCARPEASRDEEFFLSAGMVGLAGDGWGTPRVETAWRSGTALGRAIAERLA